LLASEEQRSAAVGRTDGVHCRVGFDEHSHDDEMLALNGSEQRRLLVVRVSPLEGSAAVVLLRRAPQELFERRALAGVGSLVDLLCETL